MRTVHVVVPDGIDDPARPSGGNAYDRRICDGLPGRGWNVRELAVPLPSPAPDPAGRGLLGRLLAAVPDGGVVLVDGLIASAVPEILVPASGRLRIVVLLHMPLGDGGDGDGGDGDGGVAAAAAERAVLRHARGVLTTSEWARRRVLDRYGLAPERVRVAAPGADLAGPAPGSADGGRLLCVAAVTPLKGHDVLLAALAGTPGPWRAALVGPLDRDPAFVARLRRQAAAAAIADRLDWAGPLAGDALRRRYREADVLVLASRYETYGMVVTEALAAGLPVIATEVGGLPEALGRAGGRPPGLLVPPDDAAALRAALSAWLADPALRRRLRHAALDRRAALTGWNGTVDRIASLLATVEDEPSPPGGRGTG